MAYFGPWNGPFRKPKWCFLQCEKLPLNISHCYSIRYKNLSFSAYLRPKTTQSANTRLFFGVEPETKTEKSESGYGLKVLLYYYPFKSRKRMLVWNISRCPLLKPIAWNFYLSVLRHGRGFYDVSELVFVKRIGLFCAVVKPFPFSCWGCIVLWLLSIWLIVNHFILLFSAVSSRP